MNRLMTLASSLNNVLLAQDEEEYDKVACDVVQQFSNTTELGSVNLDNLDPSYQTIAFLYVLDAHITSSINSGKAAARQLPATLLPQGRLWPHITNILLSFDPIQVRYAGSLLLRVIDLVVKAAEQAGDPVPGIQLLHHVILRLDPSSSTLTTTHHQYVRLCVLAGAYSDATLILEKPIYSIPAPDPVRQLGDRAYKHLCSVHESSSTYLTPATGLTQKITTRIYLEYFLLGAVCYIGLGPAGYKKAIPFLEAVLIAPVSQNATSTLQLDAYKKWVIIQVLVNGVSTELPKGVSQQVTRNLRTLAKPYDCLVEAFKTNLFSRIRQELQEGIDFWRADGNEGLVCELVAAFTQFQLVRLEKTYVSLPIEAITDIVMGNKNDIEATISFLTNMIQNGELKAELVPSQSGGAGILRFVSEQSNHFSEAEIEQQLAIRTQELRQLLKQISVIDHQMEISKEYIEWLQKLKVTRDREKKSNATANRASVTDVHDEDMMDDI